MAPLISIIIPVYNVESYLETCLNSVITQIYQNLEIILVNDGSTDNSGKICEKYALKDKRINVIHKQNGGLSSARNTGIKYMKGDFFAFIDSDDYVRQDYISKMYSIMMMDKSDIVICSFEKVLGDEGYSLVNEGNNEHFTFDNNEIKSKMLSRQIPMYVHGKLYRRMFASKMEFPEGKIYEDIPATWNVIKYAKRFSYIKDVMYFYRQRPDSIVNAEFKSERMEQLYSVEEILMEFKEQNKLYYQAMSLCFFCAVDNYTLVTKKFAKERLYLKEKIKKYRKGVLVDPVAQRSLKLMAFLSYISLGMIRIIGKIYKRYSYFKLKYKRSFQCLA